MPLKDMTSHATLERNLLAAQLGVMRASLEDESLVRDALLATCDTIEFLIDWVEALLDGQKNERNNPQNRDGWPKVEGGKIKGCCGPSQGSRETEREAGARRSRRARPQD